MSQRLDALKKGEGQKTKNCSNFKSTMSKSKFKVQSHEQSQVAQNTVSGATSSTNESVLDPNALHQDAHVQQQVQQRLLELNEIAPQVWLQKLSHKGVSCFYQALS